MYSQIAALFCIFIAGCFGFYRPPSFGGSGFGAGRPAICSLPTKPCRLQVTMRRYNGTLDGEIETEPCRCNGQRECPDDWSDRRHVISRNLISETHNMTLNMMFCNNIQPKEECSLGQEALVVSGYMSIPTNIEEYSCTCPDNRPLYLHQRRYAEDMLRGQLVYNTYVCANHKMSCPNYVTHCMVMREDSVRYTCKCPFGLHCTEEQNRNPVGRNYASYRMHGYCRP